jgi:hypothetical protein
MKTITRVVGLGVLVFIAPQFAMAQNERFVGTWKVNVAKSRYQPAASAPKSETLRFNAVGDRITLSLEGVNRQGPYRSESTGKFDGVDVPVYGAPLPQAALTYAFSRIDDHTWEIVIKINGEPRILVHNVVSDDGQTMKGVWRATTNQGRSTFDEVLYEKQK